MADGNYIGSFISLLTNSDLRYEGFLFQLDSEPTTIGLRNVKSFGTEGRRKDGSQVPPSEGIYEYIYFKGTDIVDVQVKSSPSGESTLNVPDDPAIIQSGFSPPTSSPEASQMENISRNAQVAVNVPYSQGNHYLDASIAGSLGSSLPSLSLNNSTSTVPSYWPGFHHLPSLSQGSIGSHPSQQKTNHSLTNMHSATNSPNILEPHHYLIPPICPDGQNALHTPQKSPVSSSCWIPSTPPPSATGSQNGFPPITPDRQNIRFPAPQMSIIGSPSHLLPLTNMHLGTNSPKFLEPRHYLIPPISPGAQNGIHTLQKSPVFSLCGIPPITPPSATGSQNGFPPISPGGQNGRFHVPQMSSIGSPSRLPSLMNMHLATNSPNVLEPHHYLIPPISPGAQNDIHSLQKSSVFSSCRISPITPPSATGSQNGFPPISPGGQNGCFPVPQMSTISSPSGFPYAPPSSATISQNGFPPVPPLSATYSLIPHKGTCSQDNLRPAGLFSDMGSLDGLPSLQLSSVTGSRDGFQFPSPLSTTHSLIPRLSPGSQSGLLPVHLLSATGCSDALHSLPPSPAAGHGFSLATPLPAAHSVAGLSSLPALNIAPSLLSNHTFSGPSTPADLKTRVASSSSTSPHVNTVTTSVKEVATSVPEPVAPYSSMLISVKPTTETCSDFGSQNHIQPSDPLLQQEKIQLPSSHSSRIIKDYDLVQVSASVALTSGSENVKEPAQQIVKPEANKKDRDALQDHHSDWGSGKGREKLPNGYRTHAKARGHEKVRDALQVGHSGRGYGKIRENLPHGAVLHAQYGYRSHTKSSGKKFKKDRDALQGGRNDQGYAKGRENLPNGAVLHTRYGFKAKARVHEASHSNKNLGGDHRSNGFILSTHRLGRGYPSGGSKVLHPVNKFTEDFDFEAMYEKFNKEEVWGLLGESTVARSEHKNQDGEETKIGDRHGFVKVDNKPVYCKDHFFDTLSSDTLDQQSGRGRLKLSERKRIDSETFGEIQKLSEKRINSETFGEIQKHQRGRGIQGPRRAGGSQGSYRGRGHDRPGRGRERTAWIRVT